MENIAEGGRRMRRSELQTCAARVPPACRERRRIWHKKAFAFSPSDDDDADEAQDAFRDWVRPPPGAVSVSRCPQHF